MLLPFRSCSCLSGEQPWWPAGLAFGRALVRQATGRQGYKLPGSGNALGRLAMAISV